MSIKAPSATSKPPAVSGLPASLLKPAVMTTVSALGIPLQGQEWDLS